MLTEMLTEKSFQNMVNNFEKTTTKEGVIYWDPTADVKLKDKPSNADLRGTTNKSGGGEDTGKDYRSDYYDNLIKGPKKKQGESQAYYDYRSRKYYAENLNRLAGGTSKFITGDDLYKKWLQGASSIKGSDKTIKEEYESGKLKGNDPKQAFYSEYPKSDLYYEESANDYRPLTNYNINKAESRTRLALDLTAGEGEIKKLQGKVGEASLSDWMTANPKKQGESDMQYVARYKKYKI
jgi:hypothetical protein